MNKPIIFLAATIIVTTGLFGMDRSQLELFKHPECSTFPFGQHADDAHYKKAYQSRIALVAPQPQAPTTPEEEEKTAEEEPHEDPAHLSCFDRWFASCLGISNNR